MKIDLRSDTVTKPSSEMWERIKNLKNTDLGDDVEQEDPTVNKLEEKAANLVGKDAALFVTSGTQGNLLSLLAQTSPGDEILLEQHSHIYKWEVGGAARLGGLMVRTFSSQKGYFDPEILNSLVRDKNDIHQPPSRLIGLENTHNYYGGIALPLNLFKLVHQFANSHTLKVHLDGARLFNAAIANNSSAAEYCKYVDSVQFCLSKGLSCPIGSIIAGSKPFIKKARKFRKMLGGGWRQAGILASMGLVALNSNWIERLKEDHKLAQILGRELSDDKLGIIIPEPDTNIVMVHLPPEVDIHRVEIKMMEKGVLAHTMGPRIRLVTHFGLNQKDIINAANIIRDIVKKELK